MRKGIHKGLKYGMCISPYVCICCACLCLAKMAAITSLYCGRPEAETAPLLRAACDFLGLEAGPQYFTLLALS